MPCFTVHFLASGR